MSLEKKSDVKSHLSRYTGIHIHHPATQSDATGFSGEESAPADAETGHPVQEPSEQQSARTGMRLPAPIGAGLTPTLVPAISKSKQA